ncbi:MAG: DNA primase [Sutterellaceae bacterium]|nr:DNA primase [Sutterellaceae bacterium]MDY2867108.1 DNA primase [Mesosutterella sp.]
MIPESFIRDLLDRVDIVDVISPYVTLKKKGINWFGLCPFHHEKTGSFSVNQNKQFYKCFGCGAHGNAIGFLMQYKGISYPEAIRELAATCGLQVPEERGARERREKADSLSDLMLRAQRFYEKEFAGSVLAQRYLASRQITEETRSKFGLGYSPESWQALEAVFGKDYTSKRLEDCGLVISREGKRYDRFRGRLMFPIRNPRGQVIGFGARIMGEGEPKYLNSPETEIFKKGHEVYGLWEGRDAVRKAGRAIVCEGYMDVIQLSQAGFREAVAALGTAIGEAHIRKLFKIVPLLYFSFDGDAAGRHAARRALEQALPVITDTQEARFILLPPEHDPDSLIKAEGPEAYEREIGKALPLSRFFVESLGEGKDLGTPEGRSKFIAEAKPLLLSMKQAPVLRQQLVNSVSLVARMEPLELSSLIGLPVPAAPRAKPLQPFSRRGRGDSPAPGRGPRGGAVPVTGIRGRMLRAFLAWPSLLVEFEPDIEECFAGSDDPAERRILEVWRKCSPLAHGGELRSGVALGLLEESSDIGLYKKLIDEEMSVPTPKDQAREEIRTGFLKIALDSVQARMQQAAAADPFDADYYEGLAKRQSQLRAELDRMNARPLPRYLGEVR